MDYKERLALGVPTIENVDYDRIYRFSSNDYDLEQVFTPYLNNRGKSAERSDTKGLEKHIDEIGAAILKNGGMEGFLPIIVDIKSLVIADGNCRWDAAISLLREGLLKSITIKVMFMDIPDEKFDDYVIILNTTPKSWTVNDYVYNYAGRNPDGAHAKLIKFCEAHDSLKKSNNGGITPRYAVGILNKPTSVLKSNKFELNDDELTTAECRLSEAESVRAALMKNKDVKANGGGWFEAYLKAWAEFRVDHPDVNMTKFVQEVKESIKNRKTKVAIPYGSNKKRDWITLFCAVLAYC